jgi:hypothetical protein
VCYGLIATNGSAADALGVWQPSFGQFEIHAGQRTSTALPGIDIKEGYRNNIGVDAAAQARILGQTAERTVALAALYSI